MSNPYQPSGFPSAPQAPYPQAPYPQAPYPQGPQGWPSYGAPVPGVGFAVTALVLSIVGLLGCWFWGVGGALGLLAVIFGILGIRRAKRGGRGMGMSVAGLVIGIIALIGGIFFLSVEAKALSEIHKCQNTSVTQDDYVACLDRIGHSDGNSL